MKIALIEPYFTGSHKQWAESYKKTSIHDVRIFQLSGRYWKWRMHGASVTLSKQLISSGFEPDLILATDMLDVACFKALLGKNYHQLPIVLYMHENQLTYPWSESDTDLMAKRDNHYGFINYTSALVSDTVFFNSRYHQEAFLMALEGQLMRFPDNKNLDTINQIKNKSETLYLGIDLACLNSKMEVEHIMERSEIPVILWNHRWEFDKDPELFFSTLMELAWEGMGFNLVVLGEKFRKSPAIFDEAKQELSDKILHWGFCENRDEYSKWLNRADILPVTSKHDYFGVSVVEAMSCGVLPLLPNDLAYPEHLSEAEKRAHLYERGEFKPRLKSMIQQYKKGSSFSDERIRLYDWSMMAPVYDRVFQEISG